MLFFIILLVLIVSVALARVWYTGSLKSLTRARLFESFGQSAAAQISRSSAVLFRRYDWIAFAGGGIVFSVLFPFLPLVYVVSFAAIAGMMIWQFHEIWLVSRVSRLEEQMADLIDLLTSSLQAGSGAVSALESALREIDKPLGPPMRDLLGRLRLGDSPQEVFKNFSERAPIEALRIFAVTMSVHWETGGRLVPLLGTVSRIIRDRMEVMRNARLQSAQGRISSIVFVSVSYLLAYAVWKYDPAVMENFVGSRGGSSLLSFLMLLQAAGIFWIHRMTQLRY